MRSWLPFSIVTAIAALTAASAQGGPPPPPNELYGFITSNRTLTAASPGPFYFVIGDLVVQPGVTLSIEPGVTLEFRANADTLKGGNYPTKCELIVNGALLGVGSATDSIRLVSSSSGSSDWGGLDLTAGGTCTLAYVGLRGAIQGIVGGGINLSNSSVTTGDGTFGVYGTSGVSVSHCVLNGTALYGIRNTSAGAVISDSELSGFTTAIELSGSPNTVLHVIASNVTNGCSSGYTTSLRECSFTGRSTSSGFGVWFAGATSTAPSDSLAPMPTVVSGFQYGIRIDGTVRNLVAYGNATGVYGRGTVYYCTIAKNGTGIEGDGGAINVLNTITALNTGLGVFGEGAYPSYNAVVDYSDSWGNGAGNIGAYVTRGAHVASFDPFFQSSGTNDYRLLPNSVFRTFSVSGGEIGGYGPGPGLPVLAQVSTWGRIKAAYR